VSNIQKNYRQEMAALGGPGRAMRTAELYEAGRAIIEARALRQQPGMEGEALRIATARLMYRKDPQVQKLLDAHEAALAV
jgi:hypothetical protein